MHTSVVYEDWSRKVKLKTVKLKMRRTENEKTYLRYLNCLYYGYILNCGLLHHTSQKKVCLRKGHQNRDAGRVGYRGGER